MSKSSKIWLCISISMILIGCILFGGVMTMLNWDFSKLSTKYETNTYEIEQPVQNITIAIKTADIVFTPSENGKASVICYEQEKVKHNVSVEDDILAISVTDTREWYDYIGIHFKTPKITVCLPQQQYNALSVKFSTGDMYIPKDFCFESMNVTGSTGDVKICASALGSMQIKTATGHIRIQNASAGTMDLAVSTGDISVADVNVNQNVTIKTNTGKTTLRNMIAGEKISVEQSTGDIDFNHCDGAEIFLKTNTGDIEGSLLTEKIFIAKSNTGDVDVPRTTTGGKCEVTTNTGDIEIEIQ